MVARDVREDDDAGVEHVRRVVAAAEPGLDDGDVDPARRELGERSRREHLELRRSGGVRADARERGVEVCVCAVDLDPLRPAAHVRRHVRADVEPLGPEQLRSQERRRRLPVRADDVDRRIAALRVAEVGEQLLHASEAELLRPRRQPL